jgi:hypothetical protein
MIAALNDLDVIIANISNAYLTAPTTKRIWTVLRPKWGANAGKNEHSMDSSRLVQHTEITSHPTCETLTSPHVLPTLTYGCVLVDDKTGPNITNTYLSMLMTCFTLRGSKSYT